MKTKAPKCSGSLAELPAGTDTFDGKTSQRALCPVCGGRIGLTQTKDGTLKYSTHYRQGKEGTAARAAQPTAEPGAARSAVQGASKFVTGSGTEYAFTAGDNGTDPAHAQGRVAVPDGKADGGYSHYDVFVTEAGVASFKNTRQGRTVKGKLV